MIPPKKKVAPKKKPNPLMAAMLAKVPPAPAMVPYSNVPQNPKPGTPVAKRQLSMLTAKHSPPSKPAAKKRTLPAALLAHQFKKKA